MVGEIGPVTLRYGLEAEQQTLFDQTIINTLLAEPSSVFLMDQFYNSPRSRAIRFYAETASWRSPTTCSSKSALSYSASSVRIGIRSDCLNLTPVGVGWSLVEGSSGSRAFYREDTQFASSYTLSPISTISLNSLDLPLVMGGNSPVNFGAQWDADMVRSSSSTERLLPAPGLPTGSRSIFPSCSDVRRDHGQDRPRRCRRKLLDRKRDRELSATLPGN